MLKIILYWLLLIAFIVIPGKTSGTGMENYDLQWRYIKNFISYVQWPADKNISHFKLCIIGKSPFGDFPDQVKLKNQQTSLVVHIFENPLQPTDVLRDCHIAYVNQNLAFDKYLYVLNQLAGLSVLSISDRENFIQHGGLIEFVTQGRKLRFIIEGSRAKEQGVVIAPALMRLSLNQRAT